MVRWNALISRTQEKGREKCALAAGMKHCCPGVGCCHVCAVHASAHPPAAMPASEAVGTALFSEALWASSLAYFRECDPATQV